MNNDFRLTEAELSAIELEARRLRADTFMTGMRSIRNWTRDALHRGRAPRTL